MLGFRPGARQHAQDRSGAPPRPTAFNEAVLPRGALLTTVLKQFLRLMLPVGIGVLFTPLAAQEADSSQAADILGAPAISWLARLAPSLQDQSKPFRLHLPWDEWGHSDLAATAANPFVPTDIQLGAVFLDGSLGQPILSAVIPSATVADGVLGPSVTDTQSPLAGADPDDLSFRIVPLQDFTRANQTYFFWDQGDYRYRDVQVGAVARLDTARNLMLAGQVRNHPGRYGLAGPELTQPTRNVLQNYLLDYQRRLASHATFSYTLLHQREQVGLPFLDSLQALTADRRLNQTWAHGAQLAIASTRWAGQLRGATMVSDLATTTDGLGTNHLSRRSLSLWVMGNVAYYLTPRWRLAAHWRTKQRWIVDEALGDQPRSLVHGRLGVHWTVGRWAAYGGLASIDGQLKSEGRLALGLSPGTLTFTTEATSFLDYPHRNRRVTLDSTAWLPGPVFLRRTTLAYRWDGAWGYAVTQLAYLKTGDQRTATTGGLALDWVLWEDVLGLEGTVTAVSSPDSLIFPTRINAFAGLSFTLPLRRARARPFLTVSTSFIYNEFSRWYDPRFADTSLLPITLERPGTVSSTLWATVEGGIKVANFELRFQIYNFTGVTIQNAPPGVFGISYLPGSRLAHYSLSWRFLPQK